MEVLHFRSFLVVQWVKGLVSSLQWLIAVMVWVRSLAWELPRAMGAAKKKKVLHFNNIKIIHVV